MIYRIDIIKAIIISVIFSTILHYIGVDINLLLLAFSIIFLFLIISFSKNLYTYLKNEISLLRKMLDKKNSETDTIWLCLDCDFRSLRFPKREVYIGLNKEVEREFEFFCPNCKSSRVVRVNPKETN